MKKITIHTSQETRKLGDLYGLFFEDINHAADGGLYPELVQNRSFEFDSIDNKDYSHLTAWEKDEGLRWEVLDSSPACGKNPHYLHVEGTAGKSFRNCGFNSGIVVEKGKSYFVTIRARTLTSGARIKVFVEDSSCCAAFDISQDQWKIYSAQINPSADCEGKLCVEFETDGAIDFDTISLFPADTFSGRTNGLRKDIAEALKEMKPKFIRFPGGCLVHDGSLNKDDRNSLYRWKNTLGPVFDRPARRNNWSYNQTLGLGYYEYFCFAEDIGASPLPVLPAAFNPHKGEGVPVNQMKEWIDDALDLIEFANGDSSTKWGKLRAEFGHEKPFNLKYIGIGNEEIGEGFFERYPYFHKTIKEKHPEIKIVNTAGPFATGQGFETGWNSARENGSDLVDEHYYCSPEWFLSNMDRYFKYDENGPHVFLGEYASWGNTFKNAIVEAAYMTKFEQAPAVDLACYAPMLCNVDYVNWKPDMLFFNNKKILKTANYHVQKMFMANQGDVELKTSLENLGGKKLLSKSEGSDGEPNISGKIVIQGNDVAGKIYDVKIVRNNREEKLNDFDVTLENIQNEICEISESDNSWSLEFKFKRSEGRKGLKILFGMTGDKDFINWEFGGWDNWDCNIASVVNGRASTLDHRIFHVTDEEYDLKLVAKNSLIETYVNGKKWNSTKNIVPEIEELYVCSSKDSSGVILKAVNLWDEDKTVEICLDDGNGSSPFKCADITTLTGDLDSENTFENPNLVVPSAESKSFDGSSFTHTFRKNSVTVIKFS